MNIQNMAFRVDASNDIGIGHVMRCLSLANELVKKNVNCCFVCRYLPLYLHDVILQNHDLILLQDQESTPLQSPLKHAEWLGVNIVFDANETVKILSHNLWDWIIVDHYALDYQWHNIVKTLTKNIMVIDDLGDRKHKCQLLLDQTLGCSKEKYIALVDTKCEIMCGVSYALLRPEFSQWRSQSIKRRMNTQINKIVITMGGIDKENVTSIILNIISTLILKPSPKITIIMGSSSPFLNHVLTLSKTLNHKTEVLVDINNMAEIMADSDLIIGASGTTTWERCCLGIPSINVVIADNQIQIANVLSKNKAAISLDLTQNFEENLKDTLINLYHQPDKRNHLGLTASKLVDGLGIHRICNRLTA